MRDFHVHTNFCDGKNSPEEMITKAIALGIKEIGIVHHSYTEFDDRYCIKKDRIDEYINLINELKEKYKKDIKIYCGVEKDFYSDCELSKFDFSIGSVHYVKKDGVYIEVDESKEILINAINNYYAGDVYALIEDYYQNVGNLVEGQIPTIIGHFDLISKFNEKGDIFNENDIRYENAWKKAVDKIIKKVNVFEINFGAISRGYRTKPYPNQKQIEYIKSLGGKFVFGSDAHNLNNFSVSIEEYKDLLK